MSWLELRLWLARIISIVLLGWTAAIVVLTKLDDPHPALVAPYGWYGIVCMLIFGVLYLSTYSEVEHYSIETGRRVFWTFLLALVAVTAFLMTATDLV